MTYPPVIQFQTREREAREQAALASERRPARLRVHPAARRARWLPLRAAVAPGDADCCTS